MAPLAAAASLILMLDPVVAMDFTIAQLSS